MLVLSRKIGEELHIGDNTVVFVQAIFGNRVRLGIQTPRERFRRTTIRRRQKTQLSYVVVRKVVDEFKSRRQFH